LLLNTCKDGKKFSLKTYWK